MKDNIRILLDILMTQKELYSEMLKLSELKRDVIVKNDIPELDQIVKKEEVILVNIGDLERSRQEILDRIAESMNIKPEELTSTKILETVSPDMRGKFDDVVEGLSDILKKLSEVNDANSKLIKFNLEYINTVINKVIMGDGKNTTYTGKGSSTTKQQKNIIDQTV